MKNFRLMSETPASRPKTQECRETWSKRIRAEEAASGFVRSHGISPASISPAPDVPGRIEAWKLFLSHLVSCWESRTALPPVRFVVEQ